MKHAYPILDPAAAPSALSACCALAMMIKIPRPGASKTRLVPPLSSYEAAALSACFVRDSAENIAAVSAQAGEEGVAVYTPVGAEAAFDNLLPETFKLLAQRGEGFGERLFYASEDLLKVGYESLCLIDSDSPTLPTTSLRKAVEALARAGDRVVLGPTLDGGYYLIGLKNRHRHLFTDIDWSTPGVLSQTIKRAEEINLEVELLPPWYDVDDGASLVYLCNELFSSNGKSVAPNGRGYDALHTRRCISDFLKTRGIFNHLTGPVAPDKQAQKRKRWDESLAR